MESSYRDLAKLYCSKFEICNTNKAISGFRAIGTWLLFGDASFGAIDNVSDNLNGTKVESQNKENEALSPIQPINYPDVLASTSRVNNEKVLRVNQEEF